MYGKIEARIFTPPLRELTPDTSYGFAVIDFARNILKAPLDPWQEWLVIHAGELLPDGNPRFRKVLLLVARQNGKTHLQRVLILFWLFIDQCKFIVSTSGNMERALEDWDLALELLETTPVLEKRMRNHKRSTFETVINTWDGCRYKAAPATSKAFRGRTLPRIVIDEFRLLTKSEAWDAATPTMTTVADAQMWLVSNAGSDASIIMNSVYDDCLKFINSNGNEGDSRLGLFEWSAVPGMAVDDREGWAMANPNVGWRFSEDYEIVGNAIAAKTGPAEEAKFRTEHLCQRVSTMNGAFDALSWNSSSKPATFEPGARIAFGLDISYSGTHVTVTAAAKCSDGRTRVGVVWAESGKDVGLKLRQQLPKLVAKHKPKAVGCFAKGPSAGQFSWLFPQKGQRPLLPVPVIDLSPNAASVCMGFSSEVSSDGVWHQDEALLTTHVLGASKKESETGQWTYTRKGECDAAYAAAGAWYVSNTLRDQVKPMLVSIPAQASGDGK